MTIEAEAEAEAALLELFIRVWMCVEEKKDRSKHKSQMSHQILGFIRVIEGMSRQIKSNL